MGVPQYKSLIVAYYYSFLFYRSYRNVIHIVGRYCISALLFSIHITQKREEDANINSYCVTQFTVVGTAGIPQSSLTPGTTRRKSRAHSRWTRNSNTNAVRQYNWILSQMNIYLFFLKDLGYNTLGFARARCLQYNQTVKWFGPDVTCEGKNHLNYRSNN